MNLRFMKNALGRCELVPYHGSMTTDSLYFFYDPEYVLKTFQENQKKITRKYLHMTLHCIFQHQYVNPSIRRPVWNLACDIAIEQMIRELNLQSIDNDNQEAQDKVLNQLRNDLNYMTAEKIYDYFLNLDLTDAAYRQIQTAFAEDDHDAWYHQPDVMGELGSAQGYMRKQGQGQGGGGQSDDEQDGNLSPEQQKKNQQSDGDGSGQGHLSPTRQQELEEARQMWEKLAQQMQTDLETFSQQQGNMAGNMMQNLRAINREKCNYEEFLRKFAVYGEVMKIDEDTFDYNFYCYGRSIYEEVALIEPLEYKDAKRVREFVIAIDTSGSVMGDTVQMFIQKTYNILKSQESFFSKVNIHIIQCDAEIQEDYKITTQEEFDEYLKTMKIKGLGGTDFRPVFEHVDELIKNKEFQNLKGMLYFTDGYGTFPEHEPSYKTAFVFLDDDYNNYQVPVWAIRVILTTDEIREK